MKRSYWPVAFYMLVVFASGVAVGAFGHLYSVHAKLETEPPRPRTPEEWRSRYVQELTSRLHLETGQVKQLNGILDETHQKYDAAKAKLRPEMKSIHDGQVAAVREMLSASQQTEYDAFRAERAKKRAMEEAAKKAKP